MTLNRFALVLTIALASTSIASAPAVAKDQKESAPAERKFDISSGARKSISDLQTAVNAKDTANIPAKLAAAQAAAKTNDDKYIIAKLQLQAAAASNDNAAIIAALEALVNSGSATNGELVPSFINLGKIAYNAKDYPKASNYFSQALKINPDEIDGLVMSAEAQNALGQPAAGVESLRKAIRLQGATGQKADENWYKRAFAFASTAKTPNAVDVGIEWVRAYPTTKNWHDLLRVYQSMNDMDVMAGLDVSRLMYTTNSLTSEGDYFRLAGPLVTKGFPGEAKAVMDQGLAKGAFTKDNASLGPLYASAVAKSAGDRASLDTAAKAASAQPLATKIVVIADAYAGYGDYAKAADLYKAALGKTGADKDLINLRLGMTLARAGDKAGATAALGAVGGTQTGTAKLWLAYVATLG